MEHLGLKIVKDFITEEEEQEILSHIKVGNRSDQKGRNSIKRYGSKLPYNSNMVSAEIPDFLKKLCDKIVSAGLLEEAPNSVTINEYMAGQGITPHVDSKASGAVITILSLKGNATMNFTRGKESFSVDYPARQLMQMQGEIREKWMHSVPCVNELRYSIVFRMGKK